MSDSTTQSSIIRPEDIGDLVVQPFLDAATSTRVGTHVTTDSPEFRIPVVTDDPSAAFVEEGAEISLSEMATDEELVVPRKVAALTRITRELAHDSSPAAASVVGQALVRDLAQTVDEAFFGDMAAPAPSGLEGVDGVTEIDAGGEFADVDPFVEAQAAVERQGTDINTWIAHPDVAVALQQLRTDTSSSNVPLLDTDPALPTRRRILGAPLMVSRHVAPGTVWGIPRDRVFVVVRQDVELATSEHPYFTSDRIALRAIMRVGFGFPHAAALAKVTVGQS